MNSRHPSPRREEGGLRAAGHMPLPRDPRDQGRIMRGLFLCAGSVISAFFLGKRCAIVNQFQKTPHRDPAGAPRRSKGAPWPPKGSSWDPKYDSNDAKNHQQIGAWLQDAPRAPPRQEWYPKLKKTNAKLLSALLKKSR